jgi:hypothetical protein
MSEAWRAHGDDADNDREQNDDRYGDDVTV